jgi:CRISPR/Cas system-associated exonuclease Cas4 (RecB family)
MRARQAHVLFSYSQISQYLRCPRSYRYRYLDGWEERESRPAKAFGRAFEKALAAYFSGDDGGAVFCKEWAASRDAPFEYKRGETWDRLFHQGIRLLERFAQEDRIRIGSPEENLQVKLPGGHEFVAYLDAIGAVDGQRRIIDWKTTTSRYVEAPQDLLSLDPQLICYSWMSGISEVALVVFVRKRNPEIQYLKASISNEHCQEFGQLVEATIGQIEAARFPSHSGIRFPRNACLSCSHLGLCLENQELIRLHLTRKSGATDLDWVDELMD